MMTAATVACMGASVMASLSLILCLWIRHRADTVCKKVMWTAVLLIPIAGWLFYGALYNPPPPQGPADRAKGNASGWYYTG